MSSRAKKQSIQAEVGAEAGATQSAPAPRRNTAVTKGTQEVRLSKQLLIYQNVVPLSSEAHRDLSVKMSETFDFARDLNSVPLLAAEFTTAVADHPIVFAGQGEAVFPAVLLGLTDGANLSVDAAGNWTGGYVPAFLRRYPFVFTPTEDGSDGNFTLCLDEASPAVNREGRGERLFNDQGGRTPWLEGKLAFAAEFHGQFHKTREFCRRLDSLGVLEDAQARYRTSDGREASMGGFAVVNRDRLKQVDPAALPALMRTGMLELCYAHLHSLQNILKLGDAALYGAATVTRAA